MSLETPEGIRRLQRKLDVKAKEEPGYCFHLFYDEVYREDILAHACRLVRHNAGAPGVYGKTFEGIETEGLDWNQSLKRTSKPVPMATGRGAVLRMRSGKCLGPLSMSLVRNPG